jgi:hypothetical protein
MDNEKRNAREDLLAKINAEMNARGLKLMKKLGDAEKGEIEITGIPKIYEFNSRFFIDAVYPVKFPNGTVGSFSIRSNANSAVSDGAIMVVLLNGRFVVVKEWRLPHGCWLYGLPRGFGEVMDSAKIHGRLGTLKIGDLPLGTLARELGEEVMATAAVTSVTHLGNVGENTGTHTGAPAVFLVQLYAPGHDDKDNVPLRGSEELQELKVELWDVARVKREMGGKLCDVFSLAALALAFNHVATLPRL